MDIVKVKVKFRKFEDGEVIALFPEEKWNEDTIASYLHVGQHGGASPELVNDLKPATKKEYAELKAELESLGYEVH